MDTLPIIRTRRLLLRPFTFGDAEDIYTYANDEEWSRFLPLPSPYRFKDAEEFVARCILRDWDETPSFAIELKDAVIGAIELQVDAKSSIASMHYAIARKHWNRGLMTEAAKAVMDWGFEGFELEKVYSWADVRNTGSWRVMEKIGMTREGILRSHGVNRDERCDFCYYGILREEWNAKLK